MKNPVRFGVLSLVLLSALALPALGQTPLKGFALSSTMQSNALENVGYVVVSGFSQAPGPQVVTYLSASGDKLLDALTFYSSGAAVPLGTTNGVNGTTNIATQTDASAVLASNQVVVIRHQATDVYERARVFSVTTTNVNLKAAVVTVPVAGDTLYPQTSTGSIAVGVATSAPISAGAAFYGSYPGRPLLMEINGGTNSTINLASGYFMQ